MLSAMPGRSEYLAHLAALPLFSACSKRELQKIARAGDEIEVEAGRVVVDQGEAGREAFVIIEGKAAVRRSDRKIATLGPGDHFGELALLDRGPRTAAIVAETPMRLFVLSSREFASVLDEVPTISHKLMAALASRIRQLDSQAYG
jgi:CRP-like cAMP-binding protein